VILYALDSNARTFRLCLISFVLIVSPVVATMIPLLIRHMVLREFARRHQAIPSGLRRYGVCKSGSPSERRSSSSVVPAKS
jgi:hypothetical protein